jgi:hypothetical protein
MKDNISFVDSREAIQKESNDAMQIIIELDNNFKHLKRLFKKHFLNRYSESNYYVVVNNDSKYAEDFKDSIEASFISNKDERMKFIYETICNKMDAIFAKNNFCEFKDNKCISCRVNNSNDLMGCCHSFDTRFIIGIQVYKDTGICKHLNGTTCDTQNISCKLYTCKYLRKNGVTFLPQHMLLTSLFLNEKQFDIIRFNFFKTKEEILEKLKERDHIPYYWWFFIGKYKIR